MVRMLPLDDRRDALRHATFALAERAAPCMIIDLMSTPRSTDALRESPGAPACIAVDLTPLLPGGENGGAKVFAMELVRALSREAPRSRFVLLTQASSHDELAVLDAANVRRECVFGQRSERSRSKLAVAWNGLTTVSPGVLVRALARRAYGIHRGAKRRAGMATLARLSPDLLFAPFTAPTYAHAGVPIVSVVHDLQHRALPAYFTEAERVFRECAVRDALDRATLLVAVSRFTGDALGAEAAGRVRVVPERLGGRLLELPVTSALPFGLTPHRYFLYPANTWPHKNHPALVRSFALARERGLAADFRLVLTGAEASGEAALKAELERLALGEAVVRAGFVETAPFAALLRSARALVFPSLYEGFGIPVVEAMAAGVPVACSNTTALQEVAGDAALALDPTDADAIAGALLRLASDEALRASLISRGVAHARAYRDPAEMARDYLRVFAEAVRP
jgi:glycosyltransferase involved in cell wall biosynthesis